MEGREFIPLWRVSARVTFPRTYTTCAQCNNPSAGLATLTPLISRKYDWTSINTPPERHRYVLRNDQMKHSRGARTNAATQITTVGFNTDFYIIIIDFFLFFSNYAKMITNTHEPNDAIPKHFCNIRR